MKIIYSWVDSSWFLSIYIGLSWTPKAIISYQSIFRLTYSIRIVVSFMFQFPYIYHLYYIYMFSVFIGYLINFFFHFFLRSFLTSYFIWSVRPFELEYSSSRLMRFSLIYDNLFFLHFSFFFLLRYNLWNNYKKAFPFKARYSFFVHQPLSHQFLRFADTIYALFFILNFLFNSQRIVAIQKKIDVFADRAMRRCSIRGVIILNILDFSVSLKDMWKEKQRSSSLIVNKLEWPIPCLNGSHSCICFLFICNDKNLEVS